MFDNRLFNVNGCGDEFLAKVLELAFEQEGRNTKCSHYAIHPEKGMILLWYNDSSDKTVQRLPCEMTAKGLVPLISQWLKSEEAEKIAMGDWEDDIDHDGSNSKGWRVYCEEWGHVANYRGAICAIKPVYLWHGK